MSQQPHIIILGAGITGLLLAQALQTASIRFSIFDGEPSLNARTREWTLNVHFAAADLRALLPTSLYNRLSEAYTNPHLMKKEGDVETLPIFNSATGELLHEIPTPGSIYLSRKRMRALCAEGLDVKWAKMCTGVEVTGNERVEVVFGDGERVLGDLVIGCDGTKSAVREVLVGKDRAERDLARLVLTTGIVKYREAEVARKVRSASPECAFGYHPDGMFNMIAISNVPNPLDPTTWEFYLAQSVLGEPPEETDNSTRLSNIKKVASKLAEAFKSSILKISNDTMVFSDKLYSWVPTPWDNHGGKITLAGDAAHPMPPFRGQGLAQSIRDVALLVNGLKGLKSKDVGKGLPGIIGNMRRR